MCSKQSRLAIELLLQDKLHENVACITWPLQCPGRVLQISSDGDE